MLGSYLVDLPKIRSCLAHSQSFWNWLHLVCANNGFHRLKCKMKDQEWIAKVCTPDPQVMQMLLLQIFSTYFSIFSFSLQSQLNWGDDSTSKKVVHVMGDTLLWQGLASVAIPGFTINRICKLSHFVLANTTSLPLSVRKWTTTALGLASIPFIIKPIDR